LILLEIKNDPLLNKLINEKSNNMNE